MKKNSFCPVLKYLICLFILVYFSGTGVAQLKVYNNQTTADLVKKVLIGGGVSVSNITYKGAAVAIGSFNGAASNIGLDSGIILCTGHIDSAVGPNNSQEAGQANFDFDGDNDLSLLAQGFSKDAAVLEFDFIPVADTVTFRYVFGSEEYDFFVCADYNDIFGFFISGPGIAGTQNIALIPGTSVPVSINNINNGSSDSSKENCLPQNSSYYINNDSGATVQYNAFTTVLEAGVSVTPCSSYHIKLAIADLNDFLYDSGIFLEAGSFTSPIKNSVQISVIGSPIRYEGCDTAVIRFSRKDDIALPLVVNYLISGSATNGVDYTMIPSTVTIPAGQLFVDLTIDIFTDALSEGMENIFLQLDTTGFCVVDNEQIFIKDVTPLSFELEYLGCHKNQVTYTVKPSGGTNDLKFYWRDYKDSLLSGASTVTFSRDTPFMVYVTVEDECLDTLILDSILIEPLDSISLTVSSDTIICKGQSVQLFASGGSSYIWSPIKGLDNPNIANPIATPDSTILYRVTVSDTGKCDEVAKVRVKVLDPSITNNQTVCIDKSVQLSVVGGHIWSWTPGKTLNDSTIKNPVASPDSTTTYFVTVTDTVYGCTFLKSVTITIDTVFPTADAGPDRITCSGKPVKIGVGPSFPGTSYEWSPKGALDSPGIANPTATVDITTTFVIKTRKSGACKGVDTVTVFVIDEIPVKFEAEVDSCKKQVIIRNLTAETDKIMWYFGDGDSTAAFQPDPHQYDKSETYTVRLVTNPYTGCALSDSITLVLNDIKPEERKVPNVFTPNGDGRNDVFKITGGNSMCAVKKVIIFNRWGEKLFESTDEEALVWDGTYQGKVLPEGVYYYILEGETFTETGHVTIMK